MTFSTHSDSKAFRLSKFSSMATGLWKIEKGYLSFIYQIAYFLKGCGQNQMHDYLEDILNITFNCRNGV